nr:envelope glycoprotein E [Felid alphaherpesvirus 1]
MGLLVTILVILLIVTSSSSTIHQVTMTEGAALLVDGDGIDPPLNKTSHFLRGWTFLETPKGCTGEVSVLKVCIDRGVCPDDIVINKRCGHKMLETPLALAEFGISNSSLIRTKDVYFVNKTVFPILTPEKSGLGIQGATTNISGIYTLHEHGDNGWSHQSTFFVTVKAKHPGPSLTPAPVHLITPHRHGAHFHVRNYHSHVYIPGDKFLLEMHLKSDIYDPEFSATIDWYFMETDIKCPVFRIYETCIFHPHAASCQHPEDPSCSFTSPLRAVSLINRFYPKCDHRYADWTSRWFNTPSINHMPYIEQPANNVDLKFINVPTNASGLYVFILRYNGHPEEWTYTLISTGAKFLNVIRDLTRPRLGSHQIETDISTSSQSPTTETPRNIHITWARRYLKVIIGIICVAGILLIVISITCYIRFRHMRYKPYEVINPFPAVYTSIPSNDPDELYFERIASNDEESADDSFDESDEEEPLNNHHISTTQHTDINPEKSGSGYSVWFRDTEDTSPQPLHAPPDYSRVVKRLKSILK